MTDQVWTFADNTGKEHAIPMAAVDDTRAYIQKHGFHAALIGRSKHGKTHVAATLSKLCQTFDVFNTDAGTMTSDKDLQDALHVNAPPCEGFVDIRKKIDTSTAECIIVDSVSAALDQSFLASQEAEQARLESSRATAKQPVLVEPNFWKHANYANSLFSGVAEAIRRACRYKGKIVVSMCGIKDLWQGEGDKRRYMGFRPHLSSTSAEKYAYVSDLYVGQVREHPLYVDPYDGQTKWDYDTLRYLTILKPNETWGFVGFRGNIEFAKQMPSQIENFNLSHFLRAYVHSLKQ